ncbi:MAG: hypothetical protein QME61_01800 [Patescibacteria group bacterium]|nr:hypothetical protein [Patescibacteria group bacterium]
MRKYLVILGVFVGIILASYFLLENFKIPLIEKEIAEKNQPPKVEIRGVGRGCGIAVAEMFFYVSDPDLEDYLTAYQIQVDDNSDFSHCPGKDCPFDTGKEIKIGETLKKYDSTYKFSLPRKLAEKIYFWRVKVWDKNDTPSNWASATLDLSR